MKTKRQKIGTIVEPIHGLNYGHTVDILDETDIPDPMWIIQPHGSQAILSVPKTAVYISNSMDYYYLDYEN